MMPPLWIFVDLFKLFSFYLLFNPLKGKDVNWLHFAIQVYIFNFWYLGTLVLSSERQSARSALSARVPECQKLKNVG